MNEDFMRQFQKMPDVMVLQKIHLRLEKIERKHRIKRYFVRSAVALIFAFGMVLIFSSEVRAQVLQAFQLQFAYAVCGFSPDIASQDSWRFNSDVASQDFWNCAKDGILTTNASQYLSLEDAQSHSGSPIILPAYIPTNFERRKDLEFFDIELRDLPSQPTVVVTWQGKSQFKLVKMLISHNAMELEEYARMLGTAGIEKTILDEKPALIARGVWNIGLKDNDFMMNAVMWRYDESTVYSLMAFEQAVPLTELIKMAESIP